MALGEFREITCLQLSLDRCFNECHSSLQSGLAEALAQGGSERVIGLFEGGQILSGIEIDLILIFMQNIVFFYSFQIRL